MAKFKGNWLTSPDALSETFGFGISGRALPANVSSKVADYTGKTSLKSKV
jgi:hypothetical protein